MIALLRRNEPLSFSLKTSVAPLSALFQALTGTWVEPSFCKLAHMQESKVPGGIRPYSDEEKVVWSQQPDLGGHGSAKHWAYVHT
jgi:hypothetical protein